MRGSLSTIVLFLLLGFCLSGCQNNASQQSNKIYIVTTTGMLGDLTKNITGDLCTVESLMGPGTDPHYYKATASDLKKLSDAKVIVYNGLELEGRMAEVIESIQDKALSAGSHLPEDQILHVEEEAPDPHIWHDAEKWSIVSQGIADDLSSRFPEHKDTFQANVQTYIESLKKLDQESLTKIHSIPEEQRVMVTAHDAFRYFGERYGIEVLGIQGTNTTAEASAKRIKELADLIAKRKIKSVFVESSVPPGTVNALIEAVESRGWNINLGGSLYSDAMGDAGTEEGTYLGMFRTNVETITNALK